jgi:hypothetical protein
VRFRLKNKRRERVRQPIGERDITLESAERETFLAAVVPGLAPREAVDVVGELSLDLIRVVAHIFADHGRLSFFREAQLRF